MKNIYIRGLLSILIMTVAAVTAAAHGSHGSHSDSHGISAGLEAGVDIDIAEDETEYVPYAALSLSYGESFFDELMDFNIGLTYTFNIEDPDYPQQLCLDGGLTFNFELSEIATLHFLLENETDFHLKPRISGENNIDGVFRPGIQLCLDFNFGEIYTRAAAPLTYISYFKEDEFGVGGEFTLGWESTFGLALEATGCFGFSPESGFEGIDALLSYTLPINNNFEFYANCTFEGIGNDEGLCIVPAIGITFNF